MKYNININQQAIYSLGLQEKTDLIDWAILDYIVNWFGLPKAKKIEIEGQIYVWINYKHLMAEMPILGLNSKQAVAYRISKLRELNLIKTFRDKDNTLYVTFTELTEKVFFSDAGSKNSFNREERPIEQGVKTDLTGGVKTDLTAQTYNHIKHNTSKYSMPEPIKSGSDQLPYEERVNQFFNSLKDQPYYSDWLKAFPDVCNDRELAKAKSWLLANSQRRKKDLKRFAYNWLAKAQEAIDRRAYYKGGTYEAKRDRVFREFGITP